MTLQFQFRIHPTDQWKPKPLARPFARVQLAHRAEQTLWESFALVDSGAEWSVFPQSFVENHITGLNFSDTHREQGRVIWRGLFTPIWLHEVEIRIKGDGRAGSRLPTLISGTGKVAFWKDRSASGDLLPAPAPYPLIGQRGILEHLEFTNLAGQKLFRLRPDRTLKRPWNEA